MCETYRYIFSRSNFNQTSAEIMTGWLTPPLYLFVFLNYWIFGWDNRHKLPTRWSLSLLFGWWSISAPTWQRDRVEQCTTSWREWIYSKVNNRPCVSLLFFENLHIFEIKSCTLLIYIPLLIGRRVWLSKMNKHFFVVFSYFGIHTHVWSFAQLIYPYLLSTHNRLISMCIRKCNPEF